jgi:hypothetical protein
MKYTISGKEWTEFDINKRCAELIGVKVSSEQYLQYSERDENIVITSNISDSDSSVDYCNNPLDTWLIIESVWDNLIFVYEYSSGLTHWSQVIEEYNCTKLVAACICFIEMSRGKL